MAIRKILYANDPRLRQKAKKIRDFGPQLKKLAEDMLETMREAHGVGLAGPQVGVMQRIFVAEIPKDEDDPEAGSQSFVLINPEITKRSTGMEEGQEGCLSIPYWYGLVERHQEIEIRAKTINDKTITLTAEGFLARVFQHETDHLDGILFIDHIKDKEKLWQVVPEKAGEADEGESRAETGQIA
jgi:peptide deformylase